MKMRFFFWYIQNRSYSTKLQSLNWNVWNLKIKKNISTPRSYHKNILSSNLAFKRLNEFVDSKEY